MGTRGSKYLETVVAAEPSAVLWLKDTCSLRCMLDTLPTLIDVFERGGGPSLGPARRLREQVLRMLLVCGHVAGVRSPTHSPLSTLGLAAAPRRAPRFSRPQHGRVSHARAYLLLAWRGRLGCGCRAGALPAPHAPPHVEPPVLLFFVSQTRGYIAPLSLA